MRTLLILRHAQASHEEGIPDRERPLTKSGSQAAVGVGQLLRTEQLLPDRIITSTALRTRDTARLVAESAQISCGIDELDELYLAEPEAYITALRRFGAAAERILLVGHNPSLEVLTRNMTGESIGFPPAGLAVCTLAIANFSELTCEVLGKIARLSRSPARKG